MTEFIFRNSSKKRKPIDPKKYLEETWTIINEKLVEIDRRDRQEVVSNDRQARRRVFSYEKLVGISKVEERRNKIKKRLMKRKK